MTSQRSLLFAVLCVVLITPAAFAGDPPARVARLNYISGEVSIQPDGVNDWVAASINRPLTSSDRIWTDKASRAELQLGGASMRMDDQTSVTLVNVSDNNVQVEVDQGTLSLHVTELFPGEIYEVDTPNVSFVVRKRGDYRFDVDNAGDITRVTAFRGEGEATGDGPAVRVSKEESYTFSNGRSMVYSVNHNPGRDGFDDWCFVRADREDRAVSARYVSRYAVGYSDLDYYGHWVTYDPYGPVWVPYTVAVGWAPYRYGHWIWVSPWGWTWVDDAPWGFAPYHYGRWVRYGRGWGWCPGPYHVRPVYAPALVAWVGGPHWGVSLSFGIGGGVGWFPLGWGEPYIPYYRHSRGYFQHVNVTNTHITNITYITNNYYNKSHVNIKYANRTVPGAVTAVSNDTFRMSRPTRSALVPVSARDLSNASVERAVPVRPTTNSMLGERAGDPRRVPPSVDVTRPSRSAPGGPPTKVAEGEQSRPGRSTANVPQSLRESMRPVESGSAQVEVARPGRAVPRPPDRGTPESVAEAERPTRVASPNRESGSSDNAVIMPSRVPRPPQAGSVSTSSSDRVNHGGRPSRDTYSPSNEVAPPQRQSNVEISRPARTDSIGAPTRVERSAPRPSEGQAVQPERGNRDARPYTPPQVERSAPRYEAPRSEPPVNVSRPPASRSEPPREVRPSAPASPPQQKQAEPAPQNNNKPDVSRPSRESKKVDNGGSASLRYPSPYNRPSSSYSYRPSSYQASARTNYAPVANVNTNSSYRTSYSSSRSYAEPSARSYSASASQSYSAPSVRSYSASSNRSYSAPRYSNNYSRSVTSHSSQPSHSSSSSHSGSRGASRSYSGGSGSRGQSSR